MRTKEDSNISFSATEFCQAMAGCKRCVDAQYLSSNEQVEYTLSQRVTVRETNFPLQQCTCCLVPNLLMPLRAKAACWIKKPQSLCPSNVYQLRNDTFPGRLKTIHCGDNPDMELSVHLHMEMYFIKLENKSITLCVGYVPSAKKECHPFHWHPPYFKGNAHVLVLPGNFCKHFFNALPSICHEWKSSLKQSNLPTALAWNTLTTSRCDGVGLKMRVFSSIETVLHSYVNWTVSHRCSLIWGIPHHLLWTSWSSFRIPQHLHGQTSPHVQSVTVRFRAWFLQIKSNEIHHNQPKMNSLWALGS